MSLNVCISQVKELLEREEYFGSEGALARFRYYFKNEIKDPVNLRIASLYARVLYSLIVVLLRGGFFNKIYAIYFIYETYQFLGKVEKKFPFGEMETEEQHVFFSLPFVMLVSLHKLNLLRFSPQVKASLESLLFQGFLIVDLAVEKELENREGVGYKNTIPGAQDLKEKNRLRSLEKLRSQMVTWMMCVMKYGLCKDQYDRIMSLQGSRVGIRETVSYGNYRACKFGEMFKRVSEPGQTRAYFHEEEIDMLPP